MSRKGRGDTITMQIAKSLTRRQKTYGHTLSDLQSDFKNLHIASLIKRLTLYDPSQVCQTAYLKICLTVFDEAIPAKECCHKVGPPRTLNIHFRSIPNKNGVFHHDTQQC